MSSNPKDEVLAVVRQRFGPVSKLSGGNSLFTIGNDAARIYFRYSRVHADGQTFFGLRQVDLRRLEAHNSYICFVADDGSPPVLLPFADFEELFRQAQPAADGQYKVQISSRKGPLELYVPRQGRFNVEGYVGLDILQRSLEAERMREVREFSHARVQTLLAEIGQLKGYDVFVPASDVGKIQWSKPDRFRIRGNVPFEIKDIGPLLSEIDVVWVTPACDSIEGAFEVEHTTTIYSALLRFNDVLLTDSRITRFSVVSEEGRRSLFARQLFRPTFRRSGLSELTSFLEYSNVFDWHSRLTRPLHEMTQTAERVTMG
ncbi:MAG TPA: hypothetical protein VEJ47_13495 [Candidatus Eremiobacteraceae bacterium]|nr:hypothetical protein [Candidatus Eremiobacteraceae bacterium]